MRGKTLEAGKLRRIFHVLHTEMGPQNWWPAGSAFEVVVGAYLTQNTAWSNVEQAIGNLRSAEALSVSGIRNIPLEELERLVRPSGYYRQKAARLKGFVAHLDTHYGGSLESLFAQPVEALREELLGLSGIGPETADAILLYAANREVFVVDAYTRRILQRHGIAQAQTGYEEIRLAVQKSLAEPGDAQSHPRNPSKAKLRRIGPASEPLAPLPHEPSPASAMERTELAQRYNEFHALLVQTAKHYCAKATPRCQSCPLRSLLPPGLLPR